jgi:2OG-Fe(II) oxygenase superfamily
MMPPPLAVPQPPSPVLDYRLHPLQARPFEHVLVESYLCPDTYQQLLATFPECPPSTGPTGYSTYWGDEAYDTLMRSQPAWQALFDAFHCQTFVDYAVLQFADVYARHGCTIDLGRATYVPYRESREDKQRRHLTDPQTAPHELWVRMDIHQGREGYRRRRHLDHRRRLVSLLVYLSDANENQMVGGDLILWSDDRSPDDTISRLVQPRHNRMVAFAAHGRSFHSVPPITSQQGFRNFIQVTVSSSVDAWPG